MATLRIVVYADKTHANIAAGVITAAAGTGAK
jgi:hypothetical protein